MIYSRLMTTESSQTIIQKMLTTTPPLFSDTEAAAIADEHFGITGSVLQLVSERDQNFRLTTEEGKRYVLKISNHAEQVEVVDFQNRALQHVEKKDASLPVPRVIPTLDGQLHGQVMHSGEGHFVRVLTWLDGSILHDATASPDLARQLGRLLARLAVGFQGFEHPGSNPPSLWDMKRAAGLAALLVYIDDPGLRQMIGRTLDRFVAHIKPLLEPLRTQVIHNDMNPDNVLMDKSNPDQVCGIIDFGDLTRSPLIIDLAVATSYQLSKGADPLAGVLPMIAGFHSITPLLTTEMEIFTDLIRTRLITSLLIGTYRSVLFPENREYLLISHRTARSFLENLNDLPADEALSRIQEACHHS